MILDVQTFGIAARSALPSIGALVVIGNVTLASHRGRPFTNSILVCIAFFYKGLMCPKPGMNHTTVSYVNKFPGLGDTTLPQSRGLQEQEEESVIDSAHHSPAFSRARQSTIRIISNTVETTGPSQDGIGILSINNRPSPDQTAGVRAVSTSDQPITPVKNNMALEKEQGYASQSGKKDNIKCGELARSYSIVGEERFVRHGVSPPLMKRQSKTLWYSAKINPQIRRKEVAAPSLPLRGSGRALDPEVEGLSENALLPSASNAHSVDSPSICPQPPRHILQLARSNLPAPPLAHIRAARTGSSIAQSRSQTTTDVSFIPRSRFVDKDIRSSIVRPRSPPSDEEADPSQNPSQPRAVAETRAQDKDEEVQGGKQKQNIMVERGSGFGDSRIWKYEQRRPCWDEFADRQSVMDRPRPIPRKLAVTPKSSFQGVKNSPGDDPAQASGRPKSSGSLQSAKYGPNPQAHSARADTNISVVATMSPPNKLLSVYLSPALTLPLTSQTDPRRKSSPVLPVHDSQESATPASVRAGRYLIGPQNQMPANQTIELRETSNDVSPQKLGGSSFPNHPSTGSADDGSAPFNGEDDGDDGTETVTVIMDRSVECPPSAASTPSPQRTSGWTKGMNGLWHRRVGENCPTFSDRNSGQWRRASKPPPPPLELEKITRRFKGPAPQISPLETPQDAFGKIQEQLRNVDESSIHRDDTELTESSMTLLEDMETEMVRQENRWQELRVDLSRTSSSTFSSSVSSPLPDPDQSKSGTMSDSLSGLQEDERSPILCTANHVEITGPNGAPPTPHADVATKSLGESAVPSSGTISVAEQNSSPVEMSRPSVDSGKAAGPARALTMKLRRSSIRISSLPAILEDPVLPTNRRSTLGVTPFPKREKSGTGTLPRAAPISSQGPMGMSSNVSVAAFHQGKRQQQGQAPLFNYSSDYDTTGYASDSSETNRYFDDGDDDSFDETTLWEIASILKSDKIPSRESLFPNQKSRQSSLYAALDDELTCESPMPAAPRQYKQEEEERKSSTQ